MKLILQLVLLTSALVKTLVICLLGKGGAQQAQSFLMVNICWAIESYINLIYNYVINKNCLVGKAFLTKLV